MNIRFYKSYTPSTRNKITLKFSKLNNLKPCKNLIKNVQYKKGRNNNGRITVRHRGGGHKRLYRIIDFKRNKKNIQGIVKSVEYDPNRNSKIALIHYKDGKKTIYITS
mmetsp:Transcript_5820/g.12961  ORF Transcript_5820/g.12961 Transcript_5820/m.12961 type:complete len:108 (+) Transcript_5820:128-451(+)